ncbi:MAG: sulfite exporter TauE/SafE family protein [Smithellaceae bacterium]
MKLNILSFFIGLAAGVFGGLAGLGGGLILIPLMLHVLKLSQHQVHGTTLVAIIFTGLSGAITYGLNGAIDLRAALLLAGASVSTVSAGAHYANKLPFWKLRRAFGFFLIFCAVFLFSKSFFTDAVGCVPGWAKIIILLLTGLGTGFLSGMMGVGGGAIMVPVMVLLVGFTQHVAQGTSLLVMVPAGVVGALTHQRLGNVVPELLWGLIPGLLLGTYLGGNFAYLLPENALRNIFAVIIIWIGLRYTRIRTTE